MAETGIDVARVDGTSSFDGVQTTELSPPILPEEADPVLAALHVAEDIYLSERGGVDRIQTALADARYQLTVAERRFDESQAVNGGSVSPARNRRQSRRGARAG